MYQKYKCIYIYIYVYNIGDEVETIINGIRNEVKSAGQQDTRENCWTFFIDRVRRQLKVLMRNFTIWP